jgi:hypothetical protein
LHLKAFNFCPLFGGIQLQKRYLFLLIFSFAKKEKKNHFCEHFPIKRQIGLCPQPTQIPTLK